VFESNLTFKGYLDGSFPKVSGMDFDASGRLVAASQEHQVRVYDNLGTQLPELGFSHPDIGLVGDFRVGPNKSYFVATQVEGPGLYEFTAAGQPVRSLDQRRTDGVAVLPSGVVWGGWIGGQGVRVFDIETGASIDSMTIGPTNSMHYSRVTDTVFLADVFHERLREFSIEGDFVREYFAPGRLNPSGMTHGPDGDLFAATGAWGFVYRWKSDGTYVGVVDISSVIPVADEILWTGNIVVVPEPATFALGIITFLTLVAMRRKVLAHLRLLAAVHIVYVHRPAAPHRD
jgi:hypothetical protein